MGDPARFRKFAAFIADTHPDRSLSIADVASGKGQLHAALYQHGYLDVMSYDRRKRNATIRRGFKYEWFDWNHAPRNYDLVVAMHPDQGTDHALAYACKHRVPFMICPCCVMPSAVEYGGLEGSYTDWKRHLIEYAKGQRMTVKDVALDFGGRNSVLYGEPR